MADTPLADVIRYLRTSGGSEGLKPDLTRYGFVSFDAGPMSNSEKAYAELAFILWGELVDKPFVFGGNNPNITLNFDTSLSDTTSGVMRMSVFTGDQRVVLINRNMYPRSDETELFDRGGSPYYTYIHEIGHALGLSHPGPYNGRAGSPDRDSVYPEDTWQYTVMSYRTSIDGNPFEFGNGGPSAPLLHDIAAIQAIYGKNTVTRKGDTTYGFNSNNEHYIRGLVLDPYDFADQPEGFAFSIYDAGGIDTIDASEFRAFGRDIFVQGGRFPHQIIDLREGQFSSIGLRTIDERSVVLKNNISIAYGTVIENAIGGGGNDTITGNAAANRLVGNDGDDTLIGGAGDDQLIGGDDDDTLRGEGDDDILDGGAGNDMLFGGDGNDILIGGLGTQDTLNGGSGFDTARYTDSRGIVYQPGRAVVGSISGDIFISIEAFDLTQAADIFEGRDERDVIDGNGGDDTLYGMGGDDLIRGGDGNDTLIGGAGDDELQGGIGADIMEGGQGGDTYFVDDPGDVVREPLLTLPGNFGRDLVVSTIDYTLPVNVEDLTLGGFGTISATGNSLGNVLTGNPAANRLDGKAGADTMRGMRGDDVYVVDDVGDVVDESSGGSADTDTVESAISFSLASTTAVLGAVENLTLTGTAAINGTGNGLDNVLIGNSAANALSGGAGDDTLIGGLGNDVLNGGAGDDVYDFRLGRLITIDLGDDTITDSAGADTIRLDSMAQLLGARRSGDDVILTLQQGTVTIRGHFAKGQIESVRADLKGAQVVLANVLIGGNASGIIPGSDGSELLDGRGGDDFLYGAGGDDILLGSEGDDILQGDAGEDRLDGGSGLDTAQFAGVRGDYRIANSKGGLTVTDTVAGRDGVDSLVDVERIAFKDGFLALDRDGNAGKVYALYKALLGRDPDSEGMGYFLRYLDGGGSVEAVAGAITTSTEVSANPAAHAELVTRLYAVWLHRVPEKEGFEFWSGRLEREKDDVGSLIADFLGSPTVFESAVSGAPADGLWYV